MSSSNNDLMSSLQEINSKCKSIIDTIITFDLQRNSWPDILDKYGLLLNQYGQIMKELSANRNILKQSTVFPSQVHDVPEYLPNLLSVFTLDFNERDEVLKDINSKFEASVKSMSAEEVNDMLSQRWEDNIKKIEEHNRYCKQLEQEAAKSLKELDVLGSRTTISAKSGKQSSTSVKSNLLSANQLFGIVFRGEGLMQQQQQQHSKPKADVLQIQTISEPSNATTATNSNTNTNITTTTTTTAIAGTSTITTAGSGSSMNNNVSVNVVKPEDPIVDINKQQKVTGSNSTTKRSRIEDIYNSKPSKRQTMSHR